CCGCCLFYGVPTTSLSTLSLHDALPISGLVIGSVVIASLGAFYSNATASAMENTSKVDGRTASLRATNFIAKDVNEGRVIEPSRSEEHTSELQSREKLVCRLLLEKKNRD